MFKDLIKQDAANSIYPLISLTAFVLFFVVLLITTYTRRKADFDEASRIPLDDSDHTFENYELEK